MTHDISDSAAAHSHMTGSQAFCCTLVNLSPDAILAHANGRIILANQAAARLFGVEGPEDLVGRDPKELTHPDYAATHRERLRRLMAGETIAPMETQILQPDGSVRDLEIRSVRVEFQGKPTALVVGRDITQRKAAERELQEAHAALELRVRTRTAELATVNAALEGEIIERIQAEAQLRESETRYRALVEASPDAILVTDIGGTICMANARAAELLRYPRVDELLGLALPEMIHPEEVNRAQDDLVRVLRNGIVAVLEYELTRRDGSTFPAEVSTAALSADNDTPPGFVGILILRDLTQRKRRETALQRHNAELRALTAIAMQARQDPELEALATTALNEVDALLAPAYAWIQLTPPDQAAPTLMLQTAVRAGPDVKAQRDTIASTALAHGAAVGADTDTGALRPLPLETGNTNARYAALGLPIRVQERDVGIFGAIASIARPAVDYQLTGQDLTFLKAVAHQIGLAAESALLARAAAEVTLLRQVDQLRSELIANFSHDLKSPLGVIKFSSTTLARDDVMFDRPTQIELLTDIETQADRLNHTVERILQLGQLEHGALQLSPAPTELGPLIAGVLASMQRGMPHHRLRQTIDPPDLTAHIDVRRIEEVLSNLVDNAIKYTPTGGEILVKGVARPDYVLISVRDPGIGIAETDLAHIFERFYRAESELKPHVAGVGLGLAVCRGIVEAHGGAIWAESQPGAGTTIFFTLPRRPPTRLRS